MYPTVTLATHDRNAVKAFRATERHTTPPVVSWVGVRGARAFGRIRVWAPGGVG